MKTVYFVRHGESEANQQKRLGSRSATPLTKLGRRQILEGAEKAKRDGLIIDVMLVSPLVRAQQSADIIAKVLQPAIIETYDNITEQDLGPYENVSYAEHANYLAFERSLQNKPGVETIESMKNRAQATINFLLSRPEKTILLVSHGSFAPHLFAAAGSELIDPEVPIVNGRIMRML